MRCTLWVGVLVVFAARADVTLRYSFDVKPGPILPPQAVEAMKSQLSMPMSYVTHLKGSKAYVETAGFRAITDFEARRVTIVDPKKKCFVAVSAGEYAQEFGRIQLPPDAQRALEMLKFDVQARATGRQDVILGIPAEEREVIFSADLPAGPQGSPGPLRLVLAMWGPKDDVIGRHPALREYAEYTARSYAGMNPADMFEKAFTQVPGMTEKLRPLMEESKNLKVVLRVHGSMFMPGLAAVMEQARAAGKELPAGVDPKAPLMEFHMDLQELSAAELSESIFEVPKDYKPALLDELMKGAVPAKPKP